MAYCFPVLQIIFLHLDPVLPLPRVRMLSVLYHVLGVVPAYQASIGPSLNELCLGLSAAEVAPADPNVDVRGRMINAGILIIDKHGNDNVSLLFPIFVNYLNKKVVFLEPVL
nr:eIF-2-alpha kinase activator GCN1 isoform X14 [Ipomoea batatas]